MSYAQIDTIMLGTRTAGDVRGLVTSWTFLMAARSLA